MAVLTTMTTISFGSWLLDKIKDKGFDKIVSLLEKSNSINEKFNNSVSTVSNKLQEKYPFILGGRMDYFFKNEQVYKELTKLIFINSVVDIDSISDSFDTDTLPKDFILEFISELKKELLKDRELESIISDKELFVLIYGITNDVEQIAKNSTLSLKEVTEIKELLQQRIGEKFVFEDFLKIYKENTLNNLSQINFIGLGVGADISKKINRKNLQDVFVKPIFKISDEDFFYEEDFDENNEELESSFNETNSEIEESNDYMPYDEYNNIVLYENLFNEFSKIVILGKPGSGKSVLVKSIICNILENKTNEFENKEILKSLPFRIELRKYLAFKKQHRGNILKYLNSLLEEEFGISNMTEKTLDNILKQKENILFFDGLDEIFMVEDKIEIKNDIENFHHSYPLTKSLTTSRIIGYDEAKFKDGEFRELEILNFTSSQIEDYLKKWYEKEEENLETRANEVSGFLEKIHEIDNELISNPLLLSLIVIIYRNTLALPESKLEIYQSCTKTLVEKWDASKKELEINLEESIYRKRENILADLAYWQYQELSGVALSITYEKALYTIASTLEKLKVADESDSYNLAEAFMEYAQKRSIYFENNFTHKTFLEYYTAYWIYSNIEKKNKTDDRNQLIEKYIDNPFWHIVLELLLNMIDKNQADTEMMDDLINHQIEKDKNSLPFILSTINSFKNVSDDCLNFVLITSIDLILINYKIENFDNGKGDETLHSRIFQNLKTLYQDSKNKKIILAKLKEIEEANIEIIDLTYSLYFELDILNSFRNDFDSKFVFELSNEDLFNKTIKANKFLFTTSSYNIFREENSNSYIQTTIEFANNFGVEELFTNTKSPFEGALFIDFFNYYLKNQFKNNNTNETVNNLKKLFEIGIEKDFLVSYFVNRHLYINMDKPIFKDLLSLYDNENDNCLSIILLLIIFNSNNHFGGSRSSILTNELLENRVKKEILVKIFNQPISTRYKEILKIYNYKLNSKTQFKNSFF